MSKYLDSIQLRLEHGFEGEGNHAWLNGRKLNMEDSLALRIHSRNGFEWGCDLWKEAGGSCQQLALAICLEIYGQALALRIYPEFMRRFIVGLPKGKNWRGELDLATFNEEVVGLLDDEPPQDNDLAVHLSVEGFFYSVLSWAPETAEEAAQIVETMKRSCTGYQAKVVSTGADGRFVEAWRLGNEEQEPEAISEEESRDHSVDVFTEMVFQQYNAELAQQLPDYTESFAKVLEFAEQMGLDYESPRIRALIQRAMLAVLAG